MNIKEWKLCDDTGKFEWYNKTRKIQRYLQYNTDPSATVIHHLRDTEEQRKYNDEHYELWGHNLDGSFEYGKYVIFVTKEEHTEIHKCSEETRNKIKESWTDDKRQTVSKKLLASNNPNYGKHFSKEHREKISASNKGKSHTESAREKIRQMSIKLWESDEYREKQMNNSPFFKDKRGELHPRYGKHHSDESKKRMSESHSGENHPNYGKHLSEDVKEKIRESNKGKLRSEETRKRISESKKGVFAGSKNPFYGKSHTDEVKSLLSTAAKDQFKEVKVIYHRYKDDGGVLQWNDFRKHYKEHSEEFSVYRTGELE